MTYKSETALVAISRLGAKMAQQLAETLEGAPDLYVVRRFSDGLLGQAIPFDLPVRSVIGDVFAKYRRLVLFMPVGAAVRLLAPHLDDKRTDPAVVCVDDAGTFAVSLVSGHVGGADALTDDVANILGAIPVITSGSHVLNTLKVDILGSDYGWRIEGDPKDITRASAAVVNGDPVGIFQDSGDRLQIEGMTGDFHRYDSIQALAGSNSQAALIITDRLIDTSIFDETPVVVYRPQTLVLGMGCRKGVPVGELKGFLCEVFSANGIALASLRNIATTSAKKQETGLTELAECLGVSIHYYSEDELNAHPGPSGPTAAYEHLGLVGVCEPAALVDSGQDDLIIHKVKSARATIAVARVNGS